MIKKERANQVKRILSFLLAVCLAAGLCLGGAGAADSQRQSDVAAALAALDIMTGDSTGDLNLSRTLTRAEFAKMAVMATADGRSAGATTVVSPYYDVPASHWAASYVAAARDLGLVKGYLDGLFHPDAPIRLEEAVTVLLRMLGYADGDIVGAYPAGQLSLYTSLGLDKDMTARQGQSLTRQDAQTLFYNLLTSKNKAGSAYLTTLGYTLTAAGEVDLVALVNGVMDGPVVAGADYRAQLSFTPNSRTVYYRNGKSAAPSAIAAYDIVYWSKSMNTVWAYSEKVTGTITAVAPTPSSPTSVTVAGVTYSIESASAALALSNLGSYHTGDLVTLLLGRNQGVAGVTAPGRSQSTLYGVVTATTTAPYQDAAGKTYTARTLHITATDGNDYAFPTQQTIADNALVRVTAESGSVVITQLSPSSLSGRVSAGATALGSYTLAADVEILDTADDGALRIYPARLAGASLSSGDVRYYVLNASGQIAKLILKDFTGDVHQYGVLTKVTDLSGAMNIMVNYEYDVGGTAGTYASSGRKFSAAAEGPVRFRWKDGALEGIDPLTRVELSSVSGLTAAAGNQEYTLAENAAVYIYRDNRYYYAALSQVTGGGYSLTGWYDAPDADGGRIRVIVARAK